MILPRNQPSNDTVGDQLLVPEELMRPFMRQASDSQVHDFYSLYKVNSNKTKVNDQHDKDPTVGAINERMFERFQDETEDAHNSTVPNKMDSNNGRTKNSIENGNETVSTSMKIKGQILKPFLGHLKSKEKFKEKDDNPKYNNEDYYNSIPVYTYPDENLPPPSDEVYNANGEITYMWFCGE